MLRGRLTIADALTQATGILDTDANPRQIYVMRGMQDQTDQPEVYRLDMTQPDAIMLSSQFQLQPLDVVYVGTAAVDHLQPDCSAGAAGHADRCSTSRN